MSEYINVRIRRVKLGYAVEAQTAAPPHAWMELHVHKSVCPDDNISNKITRLMAKTEASMLALDLSRRTNNQVVCYDENDKIDRVFVHGKNIKFFSL